MIKRDTIIAIFSLIIISLSSQFAEAWGVEIDSGQITMVVVTAIAALVRGDSVRKGEETPK